MNRFSKMAVAMAIMVLIAIPGCGSKADKAAQEMLNITKEAQTLKNGGNPAKMLELLPRIMKATQTLSEEVAKMSPDEKVKFQKKWESKFKELGEDFMK